MQISLMGDPDAGQLSGGVTRVLDRGITQCATGDQGSPTIVLDPDGAHTLGIAIARRVRAAERQAGRQAGFRRHHGQTTTRQHHQPNQIVQRAL